MIDKWMDGWMERINSCPWISKTKRASIAPRYLVLGFIVYQQVRLRKKYILPRVTYTVCLVSL